MDCATWIKLKWQTFWVWSCYHIQQLQFLYVGKYELRERASLGQLLSGEIHQCFGPGFTRLPAHPHFVRCGKGASNFAAELLPPRQAKITMVWEQNSENWMQLPPFQDSLSIASFQGSMKSTSFTVASSDEPKCSSGLAVSPLCINIIST